MSTQQPEAGGESPRTSKPLEGCTANNAARIDVRQTELYLAILDADADKFSFRTFDDNTGRADRSLARKYGGTLEHCLSDLIAASQKGAGVFVVVNEGGQRATEIKRIRVVFADTDGAPLEPILACGLEPHIVVETSPGRWHAYWLVDGLPLDKFAPVQATIAAEFGTDPTVIDLPRVMRLPGFPHQKGEPHMARIVHESGGLPYSAEKILARFPPLTGSAKLPVRQSINGEAIVVEKARHEEMLSYVARVVIEAKRNGESRDTALTRVLAERDRGRWTRSMSDDEIGRAFGGAWGKYTPIERAPDPPPNDDDERRADAALDGNSRVPSNPEHVRESAHDPCTHLANAYRIVEHFGNALLFVEGIGWHTWQRPPWRLDELGARRIVQGLGKIIAREGAELAPWVAEAGNADERERREEFMAKRFRWASASESAPNIEASLKMAASHLCIKADALDAKPLLLGLPNGVLDLATGAHREHRQSDYITKTAGCDFDADARAPIFEAFIKRIMGGDADLVDFVQRIFGCMLSGERNEHIIVVAFGTGANGKTTLWRTKQRVLGDYAGTAAPGLLMQQHGSEHPTGLADLQGRRLVVASETGEGGRLHEERVKALTGGDRISARRMRQDFYEFTPSHMIVLQTNHKPRVVGVDEGIWRRIKLIPFAVTIPADERDATLPHKLAAELPGILAWSWRGWLRYREEGLNEPDAVRNATAEYRDASDQVGAFLSERCDVDPTLTETAARLYAGYSQWCDATGERPRTQREFGMRLSERGFERARGAGGLHRWRGVQLTSDPSDRSDPDLGLIRTREDSLSVHTGKYVTSVTSVTECSAASYRLAKGDGE